MPKIINLHTNSEYSLLSSTISLNKLFKFAQKNKLKHLVLTDHNNLYGVPLFYKRCLAKGIKPIIGLDLDVENFRIILLAKNMNGYNELIRLSSLKMSDQTISFSDINQDHLITIDHPRLGIYTLAKKIPEKFSNYYRNGNDQNDQFNIWVNENVIYKKDDMKVAMKLFASIKGKIHESNINFLELSCNIDVDEKIIERTNELAKSINFSFTNVDPKNYLPKFDKERDSNVLLKEILKEKFQLNNQLKDYPKALERLKYEFQIIKKLGFEDYFLIIWDLVNWAKKEGIFVGAGRGSAAGSLISYLLNITTINPLEHDLIFERFLNPKRISMPDIDIDFEDERREEVVEYVRNKYGSKHVATINTFQRIGAKMALRDVGRFLNFSQIEMNTLSGLFPTNISLKEAYQTKAPFKAKIKSNEKYKILFKNALTIENFPRQHGTHAAGIVISKNNLSNIIPIMKISKEKNQTQYSMDYLEQFGLLKIDILGLRNLTTTKNILKIIEKHSNKKINLDNIPFNNKKTFELLTKGETIGIFQLESPGMTKTLTRVKIDKFSDIVDVISLFRPGPMAYINTYINQKRNFKNVKYLAKEYDEIVKKTNGIIIYQEQIMQIAQDFAKMDYATSDILRKAISKKNAKEIKKFKQLFIEKSVEANQNWKIAKTIFDQIEKFAEYGFNKSHAVSYATLTYWMAFLKANYKVEFYTSLLSSTGVMSTMNKYILEAKSSKLKIISPQINEITLTTFFRKKELFLPIDMIKGIGKVVASKIYNEFNLNGKYNSFFHAIARLIKVGITQVIFEKLIFANIFREYGNMKQLINNLPKATNYFDLIYNKESDTLDFSIVNEPKMVLIEKDLAFESEKENDLLGMIFNSHLAINYETDKLLSDLQVGDSAWITVYVEKIENSLSKKGMKYISITFSDATKTVRQSVFSKKWKLLISKGFCEKSLIKAKIYLKQNGNFQNYSIQDFQTIKK